MPPWTPEETWKGEDAFVIGGGPSLRGFDWTLLHDELTIGCNTAFTLSERVCKICFFGDKAWFQAFKDELAQYKGTVITNVANPAKINAHRYPWLWTVKRYPQGLHTDGLGWNGNTGASAINLALILGARRVFLLGFDMHRTEGKPNWHDQVIRWSASEPKVYQGFIQDFRLYVVKDWREKFPDRQIVNVTKDSGLGPEMFPWVDPDEFWRERKVA